MKPSVNIISHSYWQNFLNNKNLKRFSLRHFRAFLAGNIVLLTHPRLEPKNLLFTPWRKSEGAKDKKNSKYFLKNMISPRMHKSDVRRKPSNRPPPLRPKSLQSNPLFRPKKAKIFGALRSSYFGTYTPINPILLVLLLFYALLDQL